MSPQDAQSRTVAVCVLGMHRSGTSALTRLINLLGVYLGDDILPSSIDNPKGFWENRVILGVHEKLLDALDSSFDDMLSLTPGWNSDTIVKPFRNKLIEIVRGQLIQYSKLWGFKDPRVCRLLPMWREIFDSVGADARYILAIRNPEEIARSLAARDGYSLNKSLLLTLTHLLEAEAGTRGCPRVVVSYKSLMQDWQTVAKKIGAALDIAWPRSPEKIAPQVAEFLDPALWHHAIETPLKSSSALAGADPHILGWMARLHEMLLAAESDPGRIDSSLVDEIRHALEAERPRLDAWKTQRSLGRQNTILEEWGRNLDRTRQALRDENNWLKLALVRIGLDPPQILAVIKAEALSYPNIDVPPADLAAAATAGNILQMNDELQRRQAMIDHLNSDLTNLRCWNAELEKARDWLANEQAAMKKELDLRDQHLRKIESWAQELDSGRRWQADQIQVLKEELARHDEQIALLGQWSKEQEIGKNWLAAECDQFKSEYERLLKWIEELETSRKWQSEQIDAIKTELAGREKQIELLQQESREQESGKNWLAEQCEHYKSEYERMRKWTEELETGRQWLTGQIADRDKNLAELKAWVLELEQAKQWLAQQRESLLAELARRDKKSDGVPVSSEPQTSGS